MTAPARFDFAQDFSAGSAGGNRISLPRQDYDNERAACEAEGYARGFADGEAAAASAAEARLALAGEQLVAEIAGRADLLADRLAAIEQESVRLALSLARKLAAQALAVDPLAAIEHAFRALVGDLCNEREVAIRVHADLIAAAETRLGALLSASTATFSLRFVADDTLAPGDAHIDWAFGGLILDRREREARLEAIIERAFLPSPDLETPA